MTSLQSSGLPLTVTEALATQLRESICDGDLAPGTWLRQNEIAERYGVSMTPVREAFIMLEREGLLNRLDRRGVVVFTPTVEDLREIYWIRIPLEALATEKAVANLTKADWDSMQVILDRIEEIHEGGGSAAELNDEFHGIIYAAAGLPRLSSIIGRLRSASLVYVRLLRAFDRTSRHSEHQAILEACRARAPKRAARAMTEHLERTLDVVSEGLATRTTGTTTDEPN
jgi:DNA-binding GntR family transcriptional regulator